ncbi:phosphoribosyltransferase family protein [Streptosporangium sp. NPDC051022]|uniref:phosphoribosyltransferase n=1 Tax=Streptosporangium sp. NPDC051022 TaxID=3155752 RepID=UPI003434E665
MPPISNLSAPNRQRVFDHRRIWRLEPETFITAAEMLAEHERPHRPDVVIAVARGGVPLGTALGRLLDVPTVSIRLRHNRDDKLEVQATGRVDVVDCTELNRVVPGSRVLVADDICGTGATLRAVVTLLRQRLGSAGVRAVVLCRNAAGHEAEGGASPDAWVWDTRDWVVFPWEKPADTPTEPLAAPTGVRAGERAC